MQIQSETQSAKRLCLFEKVSNFRVYFLTLTEKGVPFPKTRMPFYRFKVTWEIFNCYYYYYFIFKNTFKSDH